MDFAIEENPQNLIIPLELSKTIYASWNAELVILDKPDQVYGKALHGNGTVTFKNGNIYEGDLFNGMMHGVGKFRWKNGVYYEGEFKYNSIEGKGKYFWTDGSHYVGQVKNSLREGQGIFVGPNNEATYEGQWKEGLRHGKGKIEFNGGAIYEGDFMQGYKHGVGKMLYPSQNFYEGNWKFDKKEGYGTMNWINSREKYYGNWKDNLQNGFGVHIWLENKGEGKLLRNRYEGQWKDGQRHGYGVFYYANGSKYEGEWKNNIKEGYAIFTEDNGNILQGLFKDDRLIKDDKQGATKVGSPGEDASLPKNEKGSKANAKKPSIDTTKQGADPKKVQAEVTSPTLKKKEIEANPFAFLIDINDLTDGVDDDVVRIQRDVQNMLLRHNSSLKAWYKLYSNKFTNTLGEDAFAMDLTIYWKFIQDAKILNSSTTLASINRLFGQGVKNKFDIKTEELELIKQIDFLKKLGRNLSLEEIKDISYFNLALQQSSEQQLDWNNLKEVDGNIFEGVNDVHDGKRVVLYRHFVELIVRTALLRYGNINELNRSIEKLIEQKLVPMVDQNQGKRPKSSLSEKSNMVEKRDWAAENKTVLQKIFDGLATTNKKCIFGFKDQTLKYKNLVKFLEKYGQINQNQNKQGLTDRQLLLTAIEKYFDSESTLNFIDQLQKEEQTKEKKKVSKKGDLKKNVVVRCSTQEFESKRGELLVQNLETELIYSEFSEIMIWFLFKREKDLNSSKEEEVANRLIQHLNKVANSLQDFGKASNKKAPRIWPESEKDSLKSNLAVLRVKQEQDQKDRKRRDEERKKEARERAAMALEDQNVPSDQEQGSDDDY